jgi:hypothetical protein
MHHKSYVNCSNEHYLIVTHCHLLRIQTYHMNYPFDTLRATRMRHVCCQKLRADKVADKSSQMNYSNC